MSDRKPSIAIIGGTGDLGSGLALRWAKAGYRVIIGSRSKENGEKAAKETAAISGSPVYGDENGSAAASADIIVPVSYTHLTLPTICSV